MESAEFGILGSTESLSFGGSLSNITDNEQDKKNDQALMLSLKDHSWIEALRQRAEAAEEEVMALRQQHLVLKNLCEKEKEKSQSSWKKIESLSSSLELKEREISNLKQQLEDTQEGFQKAIEDAVAEAVQEMAQQSIHSAEFATEGGDTPLLQETLDSLQSVKEENSLLSKSLGESQQHSRQLERVIQFLRERGEEAHLEVKQLREEFQANREIGVKYTQLIGTLKEKDQQLADVERDVLVANQKIKSSEEAILSMHNQISEKEQELKVAQQHLARKVKEVSILSVKSEEQFQRIQELQQSIANDQTKMTALQHQLDLQIQAEKTLQNQFSERLTAIETQVVKWEERYFQVNEKYQELEQKNRSLKSIEEKNKQAYLMLNNLSALLEPTKIALEEIKPGPNAVSAMAPIQPVNENPQNLFERPLPAVRHKKTFFD